jgi:hypothetical protein
VFLEKYIRSYRYKQDKHVPARSNPDVEKDVTVSLTQIGSSFFSLRIPSFEQHQPTATHHHITIIPSFGDRWLTWQCLE